MPIAPLIAGQFYIKTVDTVGVPGGSTTQVQYNNAGAFGGLTGATTNGTALTLVAPVLGTPASGLLSNCTGLPAASVVAGTFGAGSYAITGGVLGLPNGSESAPSLNFGTAGTGIYSTVAAWIQFTSSGVAVALIQNGGIQFKDKIGLASSIGSTPLAVLSAPSSGVLTVLDGAETSFARMQFGGTTSSFPSLKRSSAALQCRLADDSNYAAFAASAYSAGATAGVTAGPFTVVSSIQVVGGIVTVLTGT